MSQNESSFILIHAIQPWRPVMCRYASLPRLWCRLTLCALWKDAGLAFGMCHWPILPIDMSGAVQKRDILNPIMCTALLCVSALEKHRHASRLNRAFLTDPHFTHSYRLNQNSLTLSTVCFSLSWQQAVGLVCPRMVFKWWPSWFTCPKTFFCLVFLFFLQNTVAKKHLRTTSNSTRRHTCCYTITGKANITPWHRLFIQYIECRPVNVGCAP